MRPRNAMIIMVFVMAIFASTTDQVNAKGWFRISGTYATVEYTQSLRTIAD